MNRTTQTLPLAAACGVLAGADGATAAPPVFAPGVSLSHNRTYFSVHNDDVLLPNAQWSVEGDCEVGRNCPGTVPQLAPVRMVAEDVDHLVGWQRANGVTIESVLNGAGAAQHAQSHGGRDPLMERMVAHKSELRAISHT